MKKLPLKQKETNRKETTQKLLNLRKEQLLKREGTGKMKMLMREKDTITLTELSFLVQYLCAAPAQEDSSKMQSLK
jgi:hypothetical protein